MKYILNISIYLSFLKVIKTLHPMISMWSVFYTYTFYFEALADYCYKWQSHVWNGGERIGMMVTRSV